MARKILVVGGTGNVGGACALCLIEKGLSVRVLSRSENSDKLSRLPASVEIFKGGTRNKSQLAEAFRGVDGAFLCCPNTKDQVQVEKNVIDVAVAAGCVFLVKLGTCGVYTALSSPVEYGRFHAEVEAHMEKACGSMLWTVLRPNDFMQNHLGDVFSGAILAGVLEYPMSPASKARVVDTRDVGAIAAALLSLPASEIQRHHGKKYDVCGPESVSMSELSGLYSDRLSHHVRTRTITAAEWSENNSAVFPKWLADAVSLNFAEYWDKGLLNYDSSPEVKLLCPPNRTISQWVDDNVNGARVGLLGRRSPSIEPAIKVLGIPFSSNVMPCAMLALDSGAGELEMMSIDKGENRTPYALSLSPFGQVPMLRGLASSAGDLSNFSMASSNAILRYIALKFKPGAYGGEGQGNLEAKAMIDWALDWSIDFYASFGALWYPVAGVGPQPEKADAEYFRVERDKVAASLGLFIGRFLNGPSKFITGEILSIADYKIAIQCWYLGHPAVRAKTGFELPPRLVKYVADFKDACPSAALLDGGRAFMDSKL